MRFRRDKSGDAVGRPSWESSFLGHCGAKFSVENGGPAPRKKKERKASVSTGPTTTIQHMKSSLNSVSTCLKVVDTRPKPATASVQSDLPGLIHNDQRYRVRFPLCANAFGVTTQSAINPLRKTTVRRFIAIDLMVFLHADYTAKQTGGVTFSPRCVIPRQGSGGIGIRRERNCPPRGCSRYGGVLVI